MKFGLQNPFTSNDNELRNSRIAQDTMMIVALVMIVLVVFFAYQYRVQVSKLKKENASLSIVADNIVEDVLKNAGIDKGDLDVFIKGLKDLPGDRLHLVLDATGSMNEKKPFLRIILAVIVAKSGKKLTGITWFAGEEVRGYNQHHQYITTTKNRVESAYGTQKEMFDKLFEKAPFGGGIENVKQGLEDAAKADPLPTVYLLLGDEGSNDGLPASSLVPIFTMPVQNVDPAVNKRLLQDYQALADLNGGMMLRTFVE